ncbi:MAG: hypothetical protein KBD64_00845 [Gammaproteobacteria bacterium]|nr:hypothetical protein [Gammaproteobacteria bacterium]
METLKKLFAVEVSCYRSHIKPTVPESTELAIYGYDADNQLDRETCKAILANPITLKMLYEALKKHNNQIRTAVEKRQLAVLPAIVDDQSVFKYKKLPPVNRLKYCLRLPFSFIHIAIKWLVREIILNIIAMPMAYLVAFIANLGNPHYKTEASNLTKTLASVIFPGGIKKPVVSKDKFRIDLGPIVGKQITALLAYEADMELKKCYEKFSVRLDENTVLSGITANNHDCKGQGCECLNIVYFNGNSGCYQFDDTAGSAMRHLIKYKSEGVAVSSILFNYPGVLNSTGEVTQAQDLVQSGIAQIERLNKQCKIAYHRIALHGVSLGGSVAAHVASYYQDRGTPLAGAYLSRTFGSTTAVGVSYLTRALSKSPIITKIIGILVRPLIAIGTWGSRWELYTAEHYLKLPKEKRAYAVVRSPKNLRGVDDAVLGHDASLHKAWRLQFRRLIDKWIDKKSYNESRNQYKMIVAEIKVSGGPIVHCPHTDGHSEVNYNEEKEGLFLIHSPCALYLYGKEHITSIFDIDAIHAIEYLEAGKIVREYMKKWAAMCGKLAGRELVK